MGFRFRKSKNFGPFRINFSKSGVGYSFGVKGYRVTKTANGRIRQTASIPGKGLSYVTESKIKKKGRSEKESFALTEKQRKNIKRNLIILKFLFVLLIIIVAATVWAIHYETSDEEKYTVKQILYLDGHPKVFESHNAATTFYEPIKDSRVRIMSGRDYSVYTRSFDDILDDKNILYFIEDPSNSDYIGTVLINIFDTSSLDGMNIDKAISIISQYLPTGFTDYYKVDSSYIYGDDNTDVYVYACRLNEAGVEYHNNGAFQYPYYYGFRITHRKDLECWILETDYSAYGGRGIEWIEKYATPWEIELS